MVGPVASPDENEGGGGTGRVPFCVEFPFSSKGNSNTNLVSVSGVVCH